jgi:hypothetical protein
MTKRKTTAQFIQDARKIHGDKYLYQLVEYTGAHHQVKIICPDHGIFSQKPNCHLSGQGCRDCGVKTRTQKRSNGAEKFIQISKKRHLGKNYDYSSVVYSNNKARVKIICPNHGAFFQTPHDHSQGAGCPRCGKSEAGKKRSNGIALFVEKSQKIHQQKYDYSQSIYVNSKIKLKIICPIHGVFLQRPNCHLRGRGCPGCANYGIDHQKETFLYFVFIESIKSSFWKIGITSKTIEERFSEHRLISDCFMWRFDDGWQARAIEKCVLNEFYFYRLTPDKSLLGRGGFTECFKESIPWVSVLDYITQKVGAPTYKSKLSLNTIG